MSISDISIKRPVTTTMIVLLVVLLGFISFTRTNVDLFPDLVYPGAAVITSYSGTGPEEVENMVTKPIENSLATVTNIETLSSTSNKGQSVVVAEFKWGTDMDTASMDMRESIDMIRDFLPDEVNDPFVVKFDPSMLPIMQMGVTGNMDLVELKKTIEDRVIPRLERLEGVASVNMIGGKEREILIEVNQNKLNNYNTSFSNIKNTLLMNNLNMTGGNVARGNTEYLVRVTGKYESLSDIKNTKIPTNTGGLVSLHEIATVKDTYKEIKTKARMNGGPSIGLTIQKSTDANTVAVSNRINREITKLENSLNNNIKMMTIMDQAEYIEQSIGSVGKNGVIGALLAVVVLWFFLRNLRSTVIIATVIPVSIITTFMLIYFGDLTINMMTLGGLALGVGMLVDNSIVVLENIYRYRREGKTKLDAAHKGSKEVGMAIAASTITTAIVFLPVVFVGGMAAQLFKELALTVSFALFSSLIVSLTLIPVMSSKILKVNKSEDNKNMWLINLKEKYRSTLKWTLSHRWIIIVVVVVIFIASISLFPFVGREFIPSMDQGQFTITGQMPLGTPLEMTDKVAAEIEELILEIPELETMQANIGSSGQMMSGNESSSELISLSVSLIDSNKRERSTSEIMEEIRNKINIPGLEIDIQAQESMAGGFGGKPVNIKIVGDDLDILENLALSVKKNIKNISGIREVEDSISEGRPELQIQINRTLASKYGLGISQIGSFIEVAISGQTATRYQLGGEEYDITVKLSEDTIKSPEDLKNMTILTPRGSTVKLSSIADFEMEKGPKSITRENQQRYVTVSADLFKRDLGTTMEEIRSLLSKEVNIPSGYNIEYGGEFKEMTNAFKDLALAFLLAIVLVYMVMASQFESLVDPFVIMFTVPMAIIGVIPGLFITGYNISVVSIIGLVMLAGIVVNNAIVLVDYINTVRKRGKLMKEAILEAAPVRLRPILMTALTTILALLPIALGFGEGAETQAPMAIVVISGLVVATFLTLYVVPVLYTLFERFAKK